MRVRIYHDERTLLHDNGPGHPERAERVSAILRMVQADDFLPRVELASAAPADRAEIERVHASAYVDDVERTRSRPRTVFDADTSANEHSHLAALLAAGGALAATRSVLAGEAVRPFVATRPPGHHAEHDRAMGFCLFNNAAVAAAEALAAGLERVAVVDWDVHHGNGTEHLFEERADVLYASVHQYPHYPGTGRSADIGTGAGRGYTVNVPLPAGSAAPEYLDAMDRVILPVLEQYRPELVIVSAGFDGHEYDPLAGMLLEGWVYAAFTRRLVDLAGRVSSGRIVHLLEGGYDLNGLRDGVRAVLEVLADDSGAAGSEAANDASVSPREQSGEGAGYAAASAAKLAEAAIADTREALAGFWSFD